MPRLMSFGKTVPQLRHGTKDVTRRDGWTFLEVDDLVEGIEWSPRVGPRWACADVEPCGWTGTTAPLYEAGIFIDCPGCGRKAIYRRPRRLGFFRIVSIRRERLGEITPDDVLREGFPDLTPAEFIAFYCAPGRPDPDREVTRIEFRRIEAEAD